MLLDDDVALVGEGISKILVQSFPTGLVDSHRRPGVDTTAAWLVIQERWYDGWRIGVVVGRCSHFHQSAVILYLGKLAHSDAIPAIH